MRTQSRTDRKWTGQHNESACELLCPNNHISSCICLYIYIYIYIETERERERERERILLSRRTLINYFKKHFMK